MMVKILCEKCKRKCRGDVLRVSDKYFHKDCFKCSKCSKSLETGGFFIKDDGFYCQEDYQRYFIAKCKICSFDLVGEIVTVLDYSFHRECFKCTICATTFNPGDRVTVWHERFFCPNCIGHESIPTVQTQPSQPQSVQAHQLNGVTPSPMSVTEDDEGCISAADASLSELASPRVSNVQPPSTAKDKSVRVKENGESGLSKMSEAKCITSTGNPQKSKSILRKTGTDNLRIRSSSRELGYVSADSGLGDRLLDQSKTMENQPNTPVLPEQGNSCENAPVISPGTVSSSHSRQSLLFRVPNSDYGRFLTQSYIHLNGDTPVPSHTDQYKRNVSFTTLNSSTSARGPKHFHLPESKSRFLPPGTKTHTMLFGRPTTNYASTPTSTPRSNVAHTRRITPRTLASSAIELRGKPIVTRDTSEHLISNGLDTEVEPGAPMGNPKADMAGNEDEVTFEARRLACFPSGHERDKTLLAPIERYDWPGPPASAVVLAELMRERRCRRREQARQNGTLGDEADDFESQEALSIDYSFDGTLDAGIGQAILREEAEQKRRSRSHQFLDPVSASRSPNAATEPLFKPRYATHQFACELLFISSCVVEIRLCGLCGIFLDSTHFIRAYRWFHSSESPNRSVNFTG
ncbi:actin-binding LIM protein [Paragonimus westermani]|uniref:Actin-binding LIM protein n=1 Tax=Paragonimus westermani TaxID=34504 RepID=A0A5J4P3L7_9TREM|nr:actin-binding LIM protein [Paragonimus westermani]